MINRESAGAGVSRRYGRWVFVLLMILLPVVKVWLDSALRIRAETVQDFDDALYLRLAYSIAGGEWLGDYNFLTLSKSPVYPAFLALNHAIGWPLLVTQSFLYALATIFFVYQLSRHPVAKPWLLGLFVLLLFNPFVEVRVLREGIYSTLMLLVFGGFTGLYRHLLSSRGRMLGYAVLSGLFLSLFWLTREESLWLAPSLGLLTVYFAARIRSHARKETAARWAILAVPFVVVLLAIQAMSLVNYRFYGVYVVCEQTSKPYTTAVGALFRVKPARRMLHLLVPRETRERIYAVSPSFRELKPYIDGDLGHVALREGWKADACRRYPEICSDFAGSWFVWSFRVAVADAGYHASAASANAFYRRLADEVNAACDSGALDGLARRDSPAPPFVREYAAPLFRIGTRAIRYILAFPVRDYVYDPGACSDGEHEGLGAFHAITHSRVLPLAAGPREDYTAIDAGDVSKLRVLQRITGAYRFGFKWLAVAGLFAFAASAAISGRRRRLSFLFVLNGALLVAAGTRWLILSYMDITFGPAFNMWPCYITPLYPLGLAFAYLALMDLKDQLGGLSRRPRSSGEC
jgi:hypothetical protein